MVYGPLKAQIDTYAVPEMSSAVVSALFAQIDLLMQATGARRRRLQTDTSSVGGQVGQLMSARVAEVLQAQLDGPADSIGGRIKSFLTNTSHSCGWSGVGFRAALCL